MSGERPDDGVADDDGGVADRGGVADDGSVVAGEGDDGEGDDADRAGVANRGGAVSARGGRRRRWPGLVGLGLRRVVGRSTGTGGRRVLAGVLGTALAIALLVTVTAVGVGLAADATVHGSDVDYWIVPESGGDAVAVDTGGPALGSVHEAAARAGSEDGVTYATPLLAEPMRVAAGDREEYVLVVGVLGASDAPTVAGASADGLTPGDPHYAGGDYDGPWTGDLVATEGTASLLGLESGDDVSPTGTARSFEVTAVDGGASGPTGDLPVVLVHLSELQTLTGAAEHDAADQLLVATSDATVRPQLEGLYDGATVETRSSLLASGTFDEELPLALVLGATVVALVVGVLFVTVTLGLEVLDQREELATMEAIGLGRGARLAVVAVQSVTTAAVGGLVGVLVGALLVTALDRGAASVLGVSGTAVFHPLLVPFGLAVAVCVGLLALPGVLALVERVGPSGEVI